MKEQSTERAIPRKRTKVSKTEVAESVKESLSKVEVPPPSPAEALARESGRRAVEKASSFTPETIVKQVADLQLGIGRSLNSLTEQLIAESGTLAELRKAIELQRARLKELHDIEYQADLLTAMIEAQAERKAEFEQETLEKRQAFEAEMARLREEWKKEQEQRESALREREALLKKEREREAEEYKYRITIERKKDADEYAARMAALEKELAQQRDAFEKEIVERSTALAARENELVELKKRVEGFPKELEEALKKSEQTLRAELQQKYDFEQKLLAKEVDADKRVATLKIENLEDLVAKQQTRLEELTKQLQAANDQVQGIAVKAIEGASGLKALAAVNQIALEQAKGTGGKS